MIRPSLKGMRLRPLAVPGRAPTDSGGAEALVLPEALLMASCGRPSKMRSAADCKDWNTPRNRIPLLSPRTYSL